MCHLSSCLSLTHEVLKEVLKLCIDFNEHLTLFKKCCELLRVVLSHQPEFSFSFGNKLVDFGQCDAVLFNLLGEHELLILKSLLLLSLGIQLSFLCSLLVLLMHHLLLFQKELLILVLLDYFLLVCQLLQLFIVLNDLLASKLLLFFSSGLEELLQSSDLNHEHLGVTALFNLI